MLPFQRSRLMSLNPGIGFRFLFERNILIKRATETGSTCAKFIVVFRYYLFLNGLYQMLLYQKCIVLRTATDTCDFFNLKQ